MGFLKRIFGLQQRASLRNPPDWLHASLTGGERSASGVSVSPDKALTLSTYFAAIRNISEDVAKLPLLLYRRLASGGKERALGHPLYKLLHDSPNREMSSMSFR